MKANLAALIRLQTWRCEDARRAVSAAQDRIDTLSERRDWMAAALVRERACVRALPADTLVDPSAYEQRIRKEREVVLAELADAEAALASARQTLCEGLAERRKLELAEADRRRAQLRAEDRRERAALDELALHAHARKFKAAGDGYE